MYWQAGTPHAGTHSVRLAAPPTACAPKMLHRLMPPLRQLPLFFRRATSSIPPRVAAQLGRAALYGDRVPRDVRAGLSHLISAARAGDADAAYVLGTASIRMGEPNAAGGAPSAPPVKAPAPEEDAAAEAARVEAARGVIAEIKGLRRANARARASPAGAGAAQPKVTTGDWCADEDASTMPLEPSTARAAAWLSRAAAAGHADAQVALGNLLMRGVADVGPGADAAVRASAEASATPRVAEALRWYEVAANGPHPHADALFNLGMIYWEGVGGGTDNEGAVAQDLPRALSFFERAASARDASALFFYGTLLCDGHAGAGVRASPARGLKFVEAAAADGHGGAAHYLALHWRGKPGAAARSRYFLEVAADAEHAPALADLGAAHFSGENGFEVDLPGALAAFERAAAAAARSGGSDDDTRVAALLSAGAMYARGLGTPRDYTAALVRYRLAAELNSVEVREGDASEAHECITLDLSFYPPLPSLHPSLSPLYAQAWENLAAMHAVGHGVEKNIETARTFRGIAERLRAAQDAAQSAAQAARGACDTSTQESIATTQKDCGQTSCQCKTAAASKTP